MSILENHNKKIVDLLIAMAREYIKTGEPQVSDLHLFGKQVKLELLDKEK